MNSEFSPSVTHPFYFIRNGLKSAIQAHAGSLHGKLLDFGCGSKPYRSLFKVDEYIGVDYHNEGHPHHNEQIDVFYDGKSLPFPDGSFDSVLCSEVFEHVFNLEEVLKELNRVTRTGGQMLITCPFVWNEHEVPYDFARYTVFALTDILQRNGYEIVSINKSGNFVTALAQLWVLYFKETFQKSLSSFVPGRWFYKALFVAFPNIVGKFLNMILPENKTMYLNNIVLVRKK